MKCSLGITNFLEEISVLSHSTVFLYYFALITKEGFLIFCAILWNSAFKWLYLSFSPSPFASVLFLAICKGSSGNHFVCLHFFFLGTVLITTSCTVLPTSVHSSSCTHGIWSREEEFSFFHKWFGLILGTCRQKQSVSKASITMYKNRYFVLKSQLTLRIQECKHSLALQKYLIQCINIAQ